MKFIGFIGWVAVIVGSLAFVVGVSADLDVRPPSSMFPRLGDSPDHVILIAICALIVIVGILQVTAARIGLAIIEGSVAQQKMFELQKIIHKDAQ